MLDAGSANVFDAMLRVGSLRNNSEVTVTVSCENMPERTA
jgi:hypothetical protein